MGMARLNIEQQYAKISVDIQPAKIKIEKPEKSMHIHHQTPQMLVEWEAPRVELNFEEARAKLGPIAATPTTNNQMTIRSLAAIHNIAYTGGIPATQHNENGLKVTGSDPAAEVLQTIRERQAVNDVKPTHRELSPSVKWERGDLSIQWSAHEFYIEWEGESLPQITVEPCSVDIYIEQRPYIRIYLDEENLPKAVGNEVDTEL